VAKKSNSLSLFSQPLDRAAFLAYFLGAVEPLGVLAWVVQRWVRPSYGDQSGLWTLLAVFTFLCLPRSAVPGAAQDCARGGCAADRDNRRPASFDASTTRRWRATV
jgi:hypothetical protein